MHRHKLPLTDTVNMWLFFEQFNFNMFGMSQEVTTALLTTWLYIQNNWSRVGRRCLEECQFSKVNGEHCVTDVTDNTSQTKGVIIYLLIAQSLKTVLNSLKTDVCVLIGLL